MLYVEDIEKIILLTVIANKITFDKPVNLMLIAKSESGGSEILKEFEQIPMVYSTSDLTYSGLVVNLLDQIDAGKIDVIMISDYNKVIGKSITTSMQIESALCDLMEEGIHDICQIGKMRKDFTGKYVKCGIIAKITIDIYNQALIRWASSGYDERYVKVQWIYDNEQKEKIKTYLKNDLKIEKVKFILPKINGVKLSFDKTEIGIYDKLDPIIEKLYDKIYGYGFRVTVALKELCKANSFLRYIISLENKKLPKKIDLTVEQQDVNEIIRLSEYMILKEKMVPIDNSPDIKPFKQITKLTDMQKERVKLALEKQEIKQETEEEIEIKQQEIEQNKWFSFYCLELQKYIKDNSFEKLNNNQDIWWNNKLLQNKISNDNNLNEETKQKWLNELINNNNKFK